MLQKVFLPLLLVVVKATEAFLPSSLQPSPGCCSPSKSRFFGINEWRERAFEKEWDVSAADSTYSNEIVRKVPIHLMSSKRVALIGESVYLQFTKDDDLRLFQQAIDCNDGIFGLGFVSGEDVLYDKISLVEIRDYNLMGDTFGVFVTGQVVANAMVLDTKVEAGSAPNIGLDNAEEKQPLMALCSEISNRRENMSLADATKLGKTVEKLLAHVDQAESNSIDGEVEDDGECSRWSRYHEAFNAAFDCDSQGYTYSADEIYSMKGNSMYSWKQLNAISWAVFSTSRCLKEDHPYRLAALDNDCLTNRLLLATYWLADVLEDSSKQEAF